MTDEERALSILAELEHDYISYDNMQNDDAHGCKVIEQALKKQVLMKPLVKTSREYDNWEIAEEQNDPDVLNLHNRFNLGRYRAHKYYYCPECVTIFDGCGLRNNYCSRCGQAIDWEGVD